MKHADIRKMEIIDPLTGEAPIVKTGWKYLHISLNDRRLTKGQPLHVQWVWEAVLYKWTVTKRGNRQNGWVYLQEQELKLLDISPSRLKRGLTALHKLGLIEAIRKPGVKPRFRVISKKIR